MSQTSTIKTTSTTYLSVSLTESAILLLTSSFTTDTPTFSTSSSSGTETRLSVTTTSSSTPTAITLISINGQDPNTINASSTGTIEIIGTAPPESNVTLYANAVIIGTTVADPAGNWNLATTPLVNGAYNLSAEAVDSQGHSTQTTANNGAPVIVDKPSAPPAQGCPMVTESFNGSYVPSEGFSTLGDTCLGGRNDSSVPTNGSIIMRCTTATGTLPPAGWLKLTSPSSNRWGAILYNEPFRGGDGLEVTLDTAQYGGSSSGDADGISLFLVQGETNLTTAGAPGGALGYEPGPGLTPPMTGVPNGYMGIGLDVWGNFVKDVAGNNCSVRSPYGTTSSGTTTPNSITVRGPGNNMTGYCWMNTTVLPKLGAAARWLNGTSVDNAVRTVRLTLDPPDLGGIGSYKLEVNYGSGFVTEIIGNLPTPVPSTYKFGVAASTGRVTDFHLIRNVQIRTVRTC